MIELLLFVAVVLGVPVAIVHLFEGEPRETVTCACGRHSTTQPVYVHDAGHRADIARWLTDSCELCRNRVDPQMTQISQIHATPTQPHRSSAPSAKSADNPRAEASA